MSLSTKGKEDVEQNLSLTSQLHINMTHNWCLSEKNASFLRCFPATFLGPHPRHQGQDIIHKGCRDDGLAKVLLENTCLTQKAQGNSNTCRRVKSWAKAAGNPNDWIVFVHPCWALALVGASAVPAATPCGKNLSCIGMQLKNAWMERLKRRYHQNCRQKLTGKHIETWISVCNRRSFRIDRNVSTAREPSS